jgi:SAM-dependent methyltransferase
VTTVVKPPIAPMLARQVRRLPEDGYRYEPKWDGFRCLAFRAGEEVDLRSRNDRPLGRYFPEIVAALRVVSEPQFVLDGELLVATTNGFDFPALMARLHPAATKVAQLTLTTPATYVTFDVLSRGASDLRSEPFAHRRSELEHLVIDSAPSVIVTPTTDDVTTAQRWLDSYQGGGVDGVVAKRADSRYEPGKRTMIKVKHEETADCVVAGFRWYGEVPVVGSLLLGMYDDSVLRHVGVATSFTRERRAELVEQLRGFRDAVARAPVGEGICAGRRTHRSPPRRRRAMDARYGPRLGTAAAGARVRSRVRPARRAPVPHSRPLPTGFLAAERIGAEGRLISSDISAGMVDAAQRGAEARGLGNVEFRVMDAQAIELPDSSVDAVLSRFGVMLAPEPARVVREARRVLRDGGRLAYAVWGPPDRNPWLTLFVGAVLQTGHAPPGDPFGPGGVFSLAAPDANHEILDAAGFSDVRVDEIPCQLPFDDFEHYWAVQSTVAGPLAILVRSLPADEVEAIKATLEPTLAPFRSGEALSIPSLAIGVSAA